MESYILARRPWLKTVTRRCSLQSTVFHWPGKLYHAQVHLAVVVLLMLVAVLLVLSRPSSWLALELPAVPDAFSAAAARVKFHRPTDRRQPCPGCTQLPPGSRPSGQQRSAAAWPCMYTTNALKDRPSFMVSSACPAFSLSSVTSQDSVVTASQRHMHCSWWDCIATYCLHYFCKVLPINYLIHERKLLYWNKLFNSDNSVLFPLSCLVSQWFVAVGCLYGLSLIHVSRQTIKQAVWNTFSSTVE